ncbi:MAG: GntP family permease, partial [Gemmataceae bacterium]
MDPFFAYPLVLLGAGIVLLFVLIIYLRVNAFVALIVTALLVGLASPRVILVTPADATTPRLALAEVPTKVAFEFGSLMGRIGLVIAFATIIGRALMDSGAADRIVRFFTRLFGEKLAPLALLASGFVLSIPVFFDTVFFLLVPLAKVLRLRTGMNYLLYVMAIGAGGAVTHSLVPPTPGPLTMAATLHVDLGLLILMGVVVGLPVSLAGFGYAMLANRLWPVPLRQVGQTSLEEMEKEAQRPDSELPSLSASLLPIVLPVILIASATFFKSVSDRNASWNEGVLVAGTEVTPLGLLEFLGNPNVALLLAAGVALLLVAYRKRMSRSELATFSASALEEAAMILLITCAGGSFGAMLKAVGVGDVLRDLSREWGIGILFLAWGLAALFKIAQGSGTVSMISTAEIVAGIVGVGLLSATPQASAVLGYHPVYLVLAIGCGSLVGSWMNDSGFWVVGKMSGMTEKETFRSWTLT